MTATNRSAARAGAALGALALLAAAGVGCSEFRSYLARHRRPAAPAAVRAARDEAGPH
jgi:hypothetical protein